MQTLATKAGEITVTAQDFDPTASGATAVHLAQERYAADRRNLMIKDIVILAVFSMIYESAVVLLRFRARLLASFSR